LLITQRVRASKVRKWDRGYLEKEQREKEESKESPEKKKSRRSEGRRRMIGLNYRKGRPARS